MIYNSYGCGSDEESSLGKFIVDGSVQYSKEYTRAGIKVESKVMFKAICVIPACKRMAVQDLKKRPAFTFLSTGKKADVCFKTLIHWYSFECTSTPTYNPDGSLCSDIRMLDLIVFTGPARYEDICQQGFGWRNK
jgi:hypothetical protein